MRADRLVAILLLLQRRGNVTAADVATELEVSERTARRDLEALSMAGIPVYPVRGRGGGWRLAGGGTTDLSGLTSDEARALFLVAGPHADVTKEVRAALRKLVRALPEPMRDRAEAASTALVVDPTPWDAQPGAPTAPPLLDQVQAAVVDALQVRLAYGDRTGNRSERVVEPLGLVAKGRVWYLLADTETGRRTFRVDRILAVEPTGETATRPPDLDLAHEWRQVLDRMDAVRAPVEVRATVVADHLRYLVHVFGTRLAIGPAADDDGRIAVDLRGHSIPSLTAELAGFGGALEVHEPAELRHALADVGRQLVTRYAPSEG